MRCMMCDIPAVVRKPRIFGKCASYPENAYHVSRPRHAIVRTTRGIGWALRFLHTPDLQGGLNTQEAAARLNRLRKLAA